VRPLVAAVLLAGLAAPARAQSPELALRELASGQIKKGVRSIGFGGDGATWGNYALVWRDAGTALVDGGATAYTNGNVFGFTAVAFTSPELWHGLTIYGIALGQMANDVRLELKSPGLGPSAVAARGGGANQAIFLKLALPLGRSLSIGILLSYETSQFTARSDATGAPIDFHTSWLPSGGLGVAWQPHKTVLVGLRAILNHDWETRSDPSGTVSALARSYEFRAGFSLALWKGAIADVGGTLLDRANGLAGTEKLAAEPNIGFEQAFADRRLVLRAGLDESTIGGGLSVKIAPINVDVAYLYNLGRARIGTIFGEQSHSVLVTVTLDYRALVARPPSR
jgi:hypothetical protein